MSLMKYKNQRNKQIADSVRNQAAAASSTQFKVCLASAKHQVRVQEEQEVKPKLT